MSNKSKRILLPIDKDLWEAACKFQESEEFKKLFFLTENNITHVNENIGDHSLKVTNELTRVSSLSFIPNNKTRKKGETYLRTMIEAHSRRDLLIFSGFFHDLGKGAEGILRFDAHGISTATDHERYGAELATTILPQFVKSELERRYLERIIRLHGGFPLSFFRYLATQTDEDIRKILGPNDCIVETLLYMLADNGALISFKETKDYIEWKLLPLVFEKINQN